MTPLLRRTAVSIGIAVAAAAIAVPLTTGGTAAASPAALAPASQLAEGPHVPQALKADLKAAWTKPDGQRVAALQAVLEKAVAGAYGQRAAARAAKVQARMAALPASLRQDLDAAIELPKDQRQAALASVRAKVRAGAYGEVKRPLRAYRFLHRR